MSYGGIRLVRFSCIFLFGRLLANFAVVKNLGRGRPVKFWFTYVNIFMLKF